MLRFLNKKPCSIKEARQNSSDFNVATGFFMNKIKDSVKMGVLEALHVAFGGK